MFALFMWEVLFDGSVPHVFQTRFQSAPLDIGTPHFYTARQQRITTEVQVTRERSVRQP